MGAPACLQSGDAQPHSVVAFTLPFADGMRPGHFRHHPLRLTVDEGEEGPVGIEAQSAELHQGIERSVCIEKRLREGPPWQVFGKRSGFEVSTTIRSSQPGGSDKLCLGDYLEDSRGNFTLACSFVILDFGLVCLRRRVAFVPVCTGGCTGIWLFTTT